MEVANLSNEFSQFSISSRPAPPARATYSATRVGKDVLANAAPATANAAPATVVVQPIYTGGYGGGGGGGTTSVGGVGGSGYLVIVLG